VEDVLQTIRSLLALATSSNVDEARNAALAAVRLIQKHNVILSLPAEGRGTSFPAPSVRPKVVRIPKKERVDQRKEAEGWRAIRAKYEGVCKWCHKDIKLNAMIYSSKDHGAYHAVCFLQSS
jgi:hypothetical protein